MIIKWVIIINILDFKKIKINHFRFMIIIYKIVIKLLIIANNPK